MIATVGVMRLTNNVGGRVGVIDVCRDQRGSVHLRANRLGEEVVLVLAPDHARKLAELLLLAASDEVAP